MLALAFLLTGWVPFALVLPYAWRGVLPRLMGVPALLGAVAAGYTALSLRLWPDANIRVDLLFLLPVLWASYLGGCSFLLVALLRDRRRRRLAPSTRTVAAVALLAGGGWAMVSVASTARGLLKARDLGSRFDHGQRLQLAAKLQDAQSAGLAYGPLSSADPALRPWVDVWRLADADRFTTLIITGDRRVWLRFQCAGVDLE
ncbi:MAG TPA: hypothetical protein VMT85_14440, partial [Thermoanaerobaculia bacterium]|nr:hypothetical protein [Thermoanaerobaculia bacterium]